MDLMFQPLRKYADFNGRARRSEFWLFWLLLVIIQIVFSVVLSAVGGSAMMMSDPSAAVGLGGAAGVVMLALCVVMLGLLIPSLAVAVRRLHDTNRSGWWLLIGLIPFLGALALLIFYVLDGTPGPNRFGPDPKDRAASGATPAAA
jgi:uncharacterized membrane protein YhaH (DUF805 family)